MTRLAAVALGLGLWLGTAAGCASSSSRERSGPAPVDSGGAPISIDTAATADTAVATPPIAPSDSPTPIDTPPGRTQPSSGSQQQGAPQVSKVEYEGWRQYSVNCARCHGQDVLPNPVAANLLVALAPAGPIDTPEKFLEVVQNGRPDRGMPAFKDILTPAQTQAIYAYVKGRADKRIPPGRPAQPGG